MAHRELLSILYLYLNEGNSLVLLLFVYYVYKFRVTPSLAVFFALIHYIFYRWIFLDSGIIGLSTLITLFLVGFTRNSLIILTGHIGYSWALHFGWMVIMFGSMHTDITSNAYITEVDRFKLYLGSTEMLIISAIIAGIFLAYWIKKSREQST